MSIQRMHRLSIFFILFMQKIMTANITFSEAFDKYVNYLKNYKNSSQATITKKPKNPDPTQEEISSSAQTLCFCISQLSGVFSSI